MDDHRQLALGYLETLLSHLKTLPASPARDALVAEGQSLATAIKAFHLEAIRFRMYNVDRQLGLLQAPAEARAAFADIRRELEAAGFHTRSHQAPH